MTRRRHRAAVRYRSGPLPATPALLSTGASHGPTCHVLLRAESPTLSPLTADGSGKLRRENRMFTVLWATAAASAAVDLVTLPRREGTQLTIYNSEDITMVREHRLLTVKQGVNRIQFSWANTLIDPTSIDFRILDQQDKVDLVDTTFPAGRNDALQWNIQSQMAGKIPVEIRYFTSGITWTADYVGIANEDETKLQPDRLRAGDQQLGRAVRQRPDAAGGGHDQPGGEDRRPGEEAAAGTAGCDGRRSDGSARDARGASTRRAAKAQQEPARGWPGGAGRREEPKEVVKQGLSEYFLFTIEGREDIKDKEPKRLVALKVADVPLECFYKLTDRATGHPLARSRGEGPGTQDSPRPLGGRRQWTLPPLAPLPSICPRRSRTTICWRPVPQVGHGPDLREDGHPRSGTSPRRTSVPRTWAWRRPRSCSPSTTSTAASIDFLLFCTQTPDYPLPTTACLMQDRLGLPTSIGALDFNLGCSGFVYGLSLADGLIRSGVGPPRAADHGRDLLEVHRSDRPLAADDLRRRGGGHAGRGRRRAVAGLVRLRHRRPRGRHADGHRGRRPAARRTPSSRASASAGPAASTWTARNWSSSRLDVVPPLIDRVLAERQVDPRRRRHVPDAPGHRCSCSPVPQRSAGDRLAWLLVRTDLPGRRLGSCCLGLLLLVPLYLHAAAWQAAFGVQGWYTLCTDRWPGWTAGRGPIWVHAMAAVPWVVLIIGVGLLLVEPELEEQALLDGSPRQVFFRVTLRAALPAVGVAAPLGRHDHGRRNDGHRPVPRADLRRGNLHRRGSARSPTTVPLGVLPGIGRYRRCWLRAALVLCRADAARPPGQRCSADGCFAPGRWRVPLRDRPWRLCCWSLVGVPLGSLCYKAGVDVVQTDAGRVRAWLPGKCLAMIVTAPWRYPPRVRLVACDRHAGGGRGRGRGDPLAWLARRGGWRPARRCSTAAVCLAVPGPVLGLAIIWLLNRPECPGWCSSTTARSWPRGWRCGARAAGGDAHPVARLSHAAAGMLDSAAVDGAGPRLRLWRSCCRCAGRPWRSPCSWPWPWRWASWRPASSWCRRG